MKLAFFGSGRVVEWQLELFKNSKYIHILGCYDSDKNVLKRISELGVHTFSSLDELISAKPDVIAISTPSDNHFSSFKLIDSMADKNCMITIEKPTFLNQNDFTSAFSLIKVSGRKVFPIFQNRYNKAVKATKDIINSGSLGCLLHGNVTLSWCRPQRYYDQAFWRGKWQSDGGCLTNQGIHYVDLVRYLFGEIKSTIFNMDRVGVNIECENIACGILKTENRRLVTLNVNTVSRPKDHKADITLYFAKGFINIGGLASNKIIDSSLDIPQEVSEEVPHAYGYGHLRFYEKLSLALVSQDFSEILSTLEDSQSTHSILHSAYTSALLDGTRISTNGPFIDALGSTNAASTQIYSNILA
jgi:predicted dehydrogenase